MEAYAKEHVGTFEASFLPSPKILKDHAVRFTVLANQLIQIIKKRSSSINDETDEFQRSSWSSELSSVFTAKALGVKLSLLEGLVGRLEDLLEELGVKMINFGREYQEYSAKKKIQKPSSSSSSSVSTSPASGARKKKDSRPIDANESALLDMSNQDNKKRGAGEESESDNYVATDSDCGESEEKKGGKKVVTKKKAKSKSQSSDSIDRALIDALKCFRPPPSIQSSSSSSETNVQNLSMQLQIEQLKKENLQLQLSLKEK